MSGDTRQHSGSFETWWSVAGAVWAAGLVVVVAACLLAAGPGFIAGAELPAIEVEDLGPSVAARLEVALDDVDGAVQPWLASRESAPALSTAEARR